MNRWIILEVLELEILWLISVELDCKHLIYTYNFFWKYFLKKPFSSHVLSSLICFQKSESWYGASMLYILICYPAQVTLNFVPI